MTASPWYVDVDFTVERPLETEVEFDVLDVLTAFSAAMSTDRDRRGGGISFTVEAESAATTVPAIERTLKAVRSVVGPLNVTRVDVQIESARKAANANPSIPDLVGYSEIADLAGVSRQRAREIANLEGFPVAVVETAAGPLRVKEAVMSWLLTWDRKPGRPRKVATV